MSTSPLSAVGATEALGGGALALWRQAQAQMAQQAEGATPASQLREEAAQPTTTVQQPATPMRLSELRLDASHLAHTLPPRLGQRHAEPLQADDGPQPREEADDAAEPLPEHWLASLARRWLSTDVQGAQRALQLARTQWASGRRVLLVCGRRPAGFAAGTEAPGWAALLSGRPGPAGLALDGPRWPVRLLWPAPPLPSRWFSARLVKEAAPGSSWQMSPCPAPGETHVPTALQIGPVLEAERRWTQLGVRLEAGSAFRAALGAQWSLWLMSTRGVWMED